jgi:L,D-transpeptidase YcbB
MKIYFPFIWCLLLLPGYLSVSFAEAVGLPSDKFTLATRELLRGRLGAEPPAHLNVGGDFLYAAAVLPDFYQRRTYYPVWSRNGQALPAAVEMVEAIRDAYRHGFEPEHYHLQQIEGLLQRLPGSRGRALLLTDLDLLLTDAYLLLASHFQSGRVNPEAIDPTWRAQRRNGDPVAVLESALASGSVAASLQSLLPRQSEYEGLRQALQRYRQMAAEGGWPRVPGKTKLAEGSRGPRVVLLGRRLAMEDETVSLKGDVFDVELTAAVRRFQYRHGLNDDGVVGPATLAELNVPTADRVRQLEVNLERWRWLPAELGPRYVLVNIASFKLYVVEDNETKLDMRVVVGRPYRRTPVFSNLIRYLVLNPDWLVPEPIARKDILPEIKRDPAYIERMHFTVLKGWGVRSREIDPSGIDWSRIDPESFPYRLRQKPGPKNALGRVKFMFPNRYNVYLHDTPERKLFRRDRRGFSSGCIRVEHPLELAAYLLRGTSLENLSALRTALDSGMTQTVQLPNPVPVHLLYWTSWVDAQGILHFRQDIYNRDRTLRQALDSPPPRHWVLALPNSRPAEKR